MGKASTCVTWPNSYLKAEKYSNKNIKKGSVLVFQLINISNCKREYSKYYKTLNKKIFLMNVKIFYIWHKSTVYKRESISCVLCVAKPLLCKDICLEYEILVTVWEKITLVRANSYRLKITFINKDWYLPIGVMVSYGYGVTHHFMEGFQVKHCKPGKISLVGRYVP